MYGSSRLVLKKPNILVKSLENGVLAEASESGSHERTLGLKYYELSNHLGNVMAVVQDIKQVGDTEGDGTIVSYTPTLASATHYYPFGMQALSFNSADYRYGFNGKEKVIVMITELGFMIRE